MSFLRCWAIQGFIERPVGAGIMWNIGVTEQFFIKFGVMDIIHAGVVSNAIYCLYLQGIKAMNQKTALFVMINTPRRMDAS